MDVKDKVDPDEVNKTPKIIKAAKEDIGKVDVLVCGECHNAFHFITEFKEHKEKDNCSGTSVIRDNSKHEREPEMWAFMIWKHAHLKKLEGESPQSSWIIYQQWCKLDPKEKETWIVAATNIQSFSKISTAKLQEVKTVINKNKLEKPNNSVSKNTSADELSEEGEIFASCSFVGIPKLSNTQPKAVHSQIAVNKSTHNTENNTEDQSDEKPKQTIIRNTAFHPKQPSNDLIKDIKVIRKALRTSKDDDIDEAVIEKILGRRFNHKKKCTEYFIKWENFPESENTWEPKIHLIKCRVLLEEFDRAIDKKKMVAKTVKSVESQLEEMESDQGRPQRSSKQRALNQVKVWCGDMSEGEDGLGKRRSFSDDDSSDSFEKKMKFEDDSDTSEDEKPPVTIRRISKPQSSLNGVPKKTLDTAISTVPRVVRVSQKELPNLSSGVYIMSKTEGIIKLDSNNSSPGNSLLKVGSKIGQTHIKMVKKEEHIAKPTLGKLQSTSEKRFSPLFAKGRITPQKKLLSNSLSLNKSALKVQEPIDKHLDTFMDDDSDGVEELEFPTDLPLPSPDSPPGEFTLCPLTGRVLGESVDSKEEPEVPKDIEDPKEPEELKESEDSTNDNTSLDTLVKLAAAELPDVDIDVNVQIKKTDEIKKDPSMEEEDQNSFPAITSDNSLDKLIKVESVQQTSTTSLSSFTTSTNSIATTSTDLEASIKPLAIEKSTSIVLNMDEVLTTTQPKTTENSTLSTTITNVQLPSSSKPTPSKKLLSTPSTVRQKVTTFQHRQTIQRPAMPKSVPTAIIHKVSSNRNKPTMSRTFHHEPLLSTVKRTAPVATYKPANVARRIGNTTIYKTEKPSPVSAIKRQPSAQFSSSQALQHTVKPVKTVVSSIQTSSIPKPAAVSPAVINMPLLTTEDDNTTAAVRQSNNAGLSEIQTLATLATDNEVSELPTLNLADSETPLLITGDDGTIYQVAGQNEEGQTILISEGPDGQQQCVIVSSEVSTEDLPVVMQDTSTEPEQMEVDQTLPINTSGEPEEDNAESEESHVVAQIIKADPPSPGGTRKVVLMLPDGNLMMTDVTAEQYAALELDK